MGERLANKVAVITGGTSGIGEATAELFVEEGARVVFTGRTEDKGKALAERLGDNALFVKADVMSEEDIKKGINTAVDRFGGLDILFNNAGAGVSSTLTDIRERRYNTRCNSCLPVSPWASNMPSHTCKSAVADQSSTTPVLPRSATARALCFIPPPRPPSLTTPELAGTQLGAMDIRVNCISPGAVATPIFWGGNAVQLTDEHYKNRMSKLQHNLAKATPLKRSGLAMDIAMAALYLASDEGRFVNCHDLVVDGGRTSMFHEAPAD